MFNSSPLGLTTIVVGDPSDVPFAGGPGLTDHPFAEIEPIGFVFPCGRPASEPRQNKKTTARITNVGCTFITLTSNVSYKKIGFHYYASHDKRLRQRSAGSISKVVICVHLRLRTAGLRPADA